MNIQKLAKSYQLQEEKERQYLLVTDTDEMLKQFEKEFRQCPLAQKKNLIEWTKKNFNEKVQVRKYIIHLARKAAMFESESEKIFSSIFSILEPIKQNYFILTNPTKKELIPNKMLPGPEKDKFIKNFNEFKEKIKDINNTDELYNDFLYYYIKYLLDRSKFGSSANPQCLPMQKSVEVTISSALEYYSYSTKGAFLLLSYLQTPNYFSLFKLCFSKLKSLGVDFNTTIYLWSDTPHLPFNRFIMNNSYPQSIAYLFSEGLYISSYTSDKGLTIFKAPHSISKRIIAQVSKDWDWDEAQRQELTALLTQRLLSSTIKPGLSSAQNRKI